MICYSFSLVYLILYLVIYFIKENYINFPLILASKSIESIEGIVFLFSFGYTKQIKEDIKNIFCYKKREYMSLFEVESSTALSELNNQTMIN